MIKSIVGRIRNNWPRTVIAAIWLILLLTGLGWAVANNLSIRDILAVVYNYVIANPLAPLIYVTIYALRSFTLFPAMWLTLAAGSLFGFWPGLLWGLIGENLSANVAYATARFLRHEDPKHAEATKQLGLFRRLLARQAFPTVLVLRASFLPFDLVNYGCGLLHVSWPKYTLASMIGMLPPMVTFVSFGAAINFRELLTQDDFSPTELIDWQQLVVSAVLVLCSVAIVIWAQRRQRVMVWNAKQNQMGDGAVDNDQDNKTE